MSIHIQLTPVSRCEAEEKIRAQFDKKNRKDSLNFADVNGSDQEYTDLEEQQDNCMDLSNIFVEDSTRSGFSHKGLMHIEHSLMMLVVMSIVLSVLDNKMIGSINYQLPAKLLLISQTLITLGLELLIVLRYQQLLKLRKDQKIQSPRQSIVNLETMSKIAVQCVLCIVHPNVLFAEQNIILFQPYDQIYLQHRTNDLLALVMLVRCYIIIRTLVSTTVYATPRASRICRLYGCQHRFMFVIKCIMQQTPLAALTILFCITFVVFSHGLNISQQVVTKQILDSKFDLSEYANCLWTIIITMGTIGYGDYFPRTYPGRAITILAAITGVIMSSLLIITLNAYLSLSSYQNKAHITLERLKLRTTLQNLARQTIQQTVQVSFNLKTNSPELSNCFKQLKKNSQNVKVMMRKLQTIVQTENVNEEMYRLFQILKVNMKQIYMNQVKIKALLKGLYLKQGLRLKQIQFNFTNQIENMIKDS